MRARLAGLALVVREAVLRAWSWAKGLTAPVVCAVLGRHRNTLNFRRVGVLQVKGFRAAVVYRCRFCNMGAMGDAAPTVVADMARRVLTKGGRS